MIDTKTSQDLLDLAKQLCIALQSTLQDNSPSITQYVTGIRIRRAKRDGIELRATTSFVLSQDCIDYSKRF
jgi:hypothetical protein